MNDYTLVSKLGQGAFSVVYKVKRREDGKDYAMKKMRIMSLSEKQVANCLNEVRILASINNPHILTYRDSFFDELTSTFCIVTDYLEGGDLYQLITKHRNCKKAIDETTIWRVALQMLQALATLHQMHIMHRDIKSANIFLNKEGTVAKLGDMNVSIVSANGMAKTQTGTPYYASPEVWTDKPYNSKCDIWSLGCVLYEMAVLRPPFTSNDLKSLKKAIMAGTYKRIPMQYSSELENFIRLCLRTNTKERLSAMELLEQNSLKRMAQGKENIDPGMNNLRQSKLIDKICPPKKRQFKIIKTRLPRSKFETHEKSCDSSAHYLQEKTKQTVVNFLNSSKILRKDQLPTIKRSASLNVREEIEHNQSIPFKEKPPLPKCSLRA